MNKGVILNGSTLMYNNTFKNFILTKTFGLKLTFLKRFEERFENFSINTVSDFNSSQYYSLVNLFYEIVPNKKLVKDRRLVNIFFLDLINSYRGWRHSRGLPVRGQRTWTNAWTSYKSNLILREYKIILAKKLYGNIPANELNVAYLAEQVNLLWKLQWEQEWREAKKKRLVFLKKDLNLYKIDLYSMAKGNITGFTKRGEKGKKQKQVTKKNYFSLGFDPGFTKALLKSSYLNLKKASGHSKINIITESDDVKNKKKNLKKKTLITNKKKTKKDSWN